VLNASQFAGADCGAKISAADATLGSSSGEIDVNLACGAVWTTQPVLNSNHNLKFTQIGTYTIPGITLGGSDSVVDLGGSTVRIAAYSDILNPTGLPGMFTFFNGKTAASDITIQNGILDGNTANTTSAQACQIANCRSAIRIDNNNNGSAAVHGIHISHVKFQNWNNPPIVLAGSYPLAYDIWIEDNEFVDLGGYGFYSAGFDHNLVINHNHFQSWGKGITTHHADAINGFDFTGYPGTSEFGLVVTNNVFDNTVIDPDGFGFATEFPSPGYITNFQFSGNVMKDNGTNLGGALSGVFQNATISHNIWTNQGPDEVAGSNISITGNSITNGNIQLLPSQSFPSQGNTISGNTVSLPGLTAQAFPNTGINQKGIMILGFGPFSAKLTQAIRQSARSFTRADGNLTSITFHPRLSKTPQEIVVTGAFPGGASNGFSNWAFTIAGANNHGNNGTYICVASTATTMTFVNPNGVSETLPPSATMTSAASTTTYVGKFPFGSVNGLNGQTNITVSGFKNAGNNSTTLLGIASSPTVAATTNASGVNESGSGTLVYAPFMADTVVADNAVNVFHASGACDGIAIGFGPDGMGTLYNISVVENTISGNSNAPCAAIGLGTAASTPQSSGIEILNNNMSNIGFGVWAKSPTAAAVTDVTIAGNKMSNVAMPFYFQVKPPILRMWNNVTSAEETKESLNGGVTIDDHGNVVTPGSLNGHGGFMIAPGAGKQAFFFIPGDNLSTTKEIYGTDKANNSYMWWVNDDGSARFTNLPQVGTPTVGRVACIKSAGPPVVIGNCTTVPNSSGACTCN